MRMVRCEMQKMDILHFLSFSPENSFFLQLTMPSPKKMFAHQLGFAQFEEVMKGQIKLYVQRQLSNTLIAGADSRFEVC
jgi:hypothetical protein